MERFTARRAIYWILGVLEVLFAFRLIFRLMGANPESGFVRFIYAGSNVFLIPFISIFSAPSTEGIETKAVLEPGTLIGMVVYALLAWGIVKMIIIFRKAKLDQA